MNHRWTAPARRLTAIFALLLLFASGCVTERIVPEVETRDDTPRKFIVVLEGRNYLFDDGGEPTRLGFLTTRHVIAVSAKAAEQAAMREVQRDEELNARTVNRVSDPPRLTVSRHFEVESFAEDTSPQLGYIFYEDHESK